MTMWIVALLVVVPSHAGWRLDRYEALKDNSSQTITADVKVDANGVATGMGSRVENNPKQSPRFDSGLYGSVAIVASQTSYHSYGGGHGEPCFGIPLADGDVSATMTIVAVFKWEGGEDEPPSKDFFITENSFVAASSSASPAKVKNLEIRKAELGLGQGQPVVNSSIGYFSKRQTTPTLISSGGRTEVRGPSRTLIINVKTPGYSHNDMNGSWPWDVGISAYASYSAEVSQFDIGVSAPNMEWLKWELRDKEVNAYADREWKDATHFDWVGSASYSANLSQSLRDQLGNSSYHWNDSGQWSDDAGNLEDQSSVTRKYKFGSDGPFGESQATSVKLIVQGADGTIGDLTAKAKINWYEMPKTQFRIENYVVVRDFANNGGQPEEFDSLRSALDGTSEESQIDGYIAEIQNAYRDTQGAGTALVGGAINVEAATTTLLFPDTLLPPGAGSTLKVFAIGRQAVAFAQTAIDVGNSLNNSQGRIFDAIRTKRGGGDIVVELHQRVIAVARTGHLPPNSVRSQEPLGIVSDTIIWSKGSACFVKGTLVSTQNGLRAIETLKQGELVWSRDATTGTTQLKPIKQTFEKHSATLALEFSNGETIETTREHPFYVADRGFVAAGELGIGTSIVTRAGPSVQLVSAKPGTLETVYNFEVEDFHTYFVGSGEVWVHNTCLVIGSNLDSVMQGCPFKPGSQGTVSESIVNSYLQLLKSNPDAVWSRGGVNKIIISADGHILNGYHRVVAAQLAGVPIPESAIYRSSTNAAVTRNWSEVIVQN